MLENDPIREIVLDGMFRKKFTVTEFVHKLRYALKEDVNKAYQSGYAAGLQAGKDQFGTPPNFNPNL
jgi:hypothetical protein